MEEYIKLSIVDIVDHKGSRLTDGVEAALDDADRYALENDNRYTHEEVFSGLRRKVNG